MPNITRLSGRAKEIPTMPQLNRVIPRDDPDAPTTAALRRRLQIAGQLQSPVQTASAAIQHDRCLLCGCNIRNDRVADREIGACGSCKSRPEARRLQAASGTGASRAFTEAEKSLIRKTHGYIPIQQLLGILNERLKNDLGPNALPHTAEQLHAEITKIGGAMPNNGSGWAALRKSLAHAKAAGTLDLITEQIITDFAVVFLLSPNQVIRLQDVLLSREEDEP
jgi:hypothetical protein